MTGTRKRRGGAAIAAGGFGCVFRPALRCKAGTHEASLYRRADVSKLMRKHDAEEEMREVARVVPVLRLIPNAARYFMGIGSAGTFYSCEPAPLTERDKLHYRICRPLRKHDYTAQNVNDKLSDLRVINQTDGGMELNVAWGVANHAGTGPGAAAMAHATRGFHAINASLQRLLVHGVVPLNKLGVLHGDLKAANVLVDKGPAAKPGGRYASRRPIAHLLGNMSPAEAADPGILSSRIIDWGLAMYFKAPSGPMASYPASVPSSLREGKYTLFNMPITAILFDDAMQPIIKHEVRTFLPSGDVGLGRTLAMRNAASRVYLTHLTSVRGHGHDEYLAQILRGLFHGSPVAVMQGGEASDMASPQGLIVDYLARALDRYVDRDGNFRRLAFFQEVFRFNCDVYGLLTCYLPLVEAPTDVPAVATWSRNSLTNGVVRMLAEYCYGPKYAAEAIPIPEVIATLKNLGLSRLARHLPARARVGPGAAGAGAAPRPAAPHPSPAADSRDASRGGPGARPKRCPSGTRRDKNTGRCTRSRARAAGPGARPKRCPKGTRRDKNTGRCVKGAPRAQPAARHGSSIQTVSARKRCPRGYRRNKDTGKCHRTRRNS